MPRRPRMSCGGWQSCSPARDRLQLLGSRRARSASSAAVRQERLQRAAPRRLLRQSREPGLPAVPSAVVQRAMGSTLLRQHHWMGEEWEGMRGYPRRPAASLLLRLVRRAKRASRPRVWGPGVRLAAQTSRVRRLARHTRGRVRARPKLRRCRRARRRRLRRSRTDC